MAMAASASTTFISKRHVLFSGWAANAQVESQGHGDTRHSSLLVVDVPAEFDVTSSFREDLVDHQILASKVECIELLRLKPLVRLVPARARASSDILACSLVNLSLALSMKKLNSSPFASCQHRLPSLVLRVYMCVYIHTYTSYF